ncbi:hypothetical protein HPB47_010783, partial [Ixodes persulcatus]
MSLWRGHVIACSEHSKHRDRRYELSVAGDTKDPQLFHQLIILLIPISPTEDCTLALVKLQLETYAYLFIYVQELLQVLWKASAFLLAATKGKFYFKEVIISVPSSWPPMGRQEVWEDLFNQADVQVASSLKEPDTLNPSRSFPGDFNPVRLPSKFVRGLNSTTTKKFGKPEYHLIHHWANHRYGVFAEHASSPDKALYCSHNK